MPASSSSGELASFAAALAGQYELEREVGRGGMGVVYLARDLRLDRMVAIKTLPAALAGDTSVRERFLREARTAARLSHPNIVPIHRADEIAGQVFFVMGFVDGDSLAAKVAAGPLAPRDVVPILRDVAAALGFAHQRGVIHRDVKMENILLDTISGRAMVTDFGIARVVAAQPLTATGQVLGTVYYLSPEQVSGDEVDARSDIYALGVVGYFLLSGRFPFDGPLASAVLVSHVTRTPPPLASVAPHVPASLAGIIDRCLAKSPEQRFQSCAELEAALDAARADANAVTTAPRLGVTPLLSDTEAQQVLLRAAELEMTNARLRPVIPIARDAIADAERREGFKTSVLRESAAEVGIDPRNVERALAEHGLRPIPSRADKPDRRRTSVVHDLTAKPGPLDGEPTELRYEMVFDGEVPEDDYDVLVEIIRKHWPEDGMGGMVGRTLTWKGVSRRQRVLQVSVQPRAGRTTLTVQENFRQIANIIYIGTVGAVGIGAGGGFALQAIHDGSWGAAVVVLLTMLGVGCAAGVGTVKALSERRGRALRRLVDEMAAQVQDLIATKHSLK